MRVIHFSFQMSEGHLYPNPTGMRKGGNMTSLHVKTKIIKEDYLIF